MSKKTGLTILCWSASAFILDFFVSCALFFQPSWAVGWPGEISPAMLFACGAGLAVFVAVVSLAGMLAPLCSLIESRHAGREAGTLCFIALFAAASVLGCLASLLFFAWILTSK